MQPKVIAMDRQTYRGDTIIEVMFATAIAGLIIVLSMAVMNRGVATAQMALEHTLVRQYIDGQADSLRYIRDTADAGSPAGKAMWDELKELPSNQPFYIKINESNIEIEEYNGTLLGNTDPFAVPGQGISIMAHKPAERYIDFHIKAEWEPPFSGPQASIGTIVRLYD